MLRWRRWKRLPAVNVVGVDYAEPMLAGARKRFAGSQHVELLHADAARLPYEDDSFDTANIANSYHCFPDVPGALRSVHRVLKPGGVLCVNVLVHPRGRWPLKAIADRINKWGIRKGILYRPYDPREVREAMTTVGFDVESEALSGNCYDIRARKRRK
jgi:ubiquinone/menaquinone biosynthesis C-methylase UbiE